MRILITSAEVAPFAKVGGLADVAGALPKALRDLGHDVRVAMPCYKMVETNPAYAVEELLPAFSVPIRPGVVEQAFVKRTFIRSHTRTEAAGDDSSWCDAAPGNDEDIPVLLIGNPGSRGRPGYFEEATESKKVYSLAPEPYVFFCRAVLEMLQQFHDGWAPDIIHCNDWQSGLIPVYARVFYGNIPALSGAATVFTIHNLAYQGNFERQHWPSTGLPDYLNTIEGLEFYGGWSFMKAGLTFADRINTVSVSYANEIKTEEYGCGLHGLMQTLFEKSRLSGILNGIDYEEYDPEKDPRLPANFSASDLTGKARCRAALQSELNLASETDVPVIGLVSRLADQKGLDLIYEVMDLMLALPVQFALLGTGDPFYEQFFTKLQESHPGRVHARIGFDVELAQRIYAGSDLFLMPSRFEPCGLGQMMALRYGTLPIVRKTGGLADSIHGYGTSEDANGFVFSEYSGPALLEAIRQAVTLFKNRGAWLALVQRAMQCDFSWERSALRYEALYCDAVAAHISGQQPLFMEARLADRSKGSVG